jgi:hypothetical protein
MPVATSQASVVPIDLHESTVVPEESSTEHAGRHAGSPRDCGWQRYPSRPHDWPTCPQIPTHRGVCVEPPTCTHSVAPGQLQEVPADALVEQSWVQ